MDVIDERNLERFQFKMSFWWIFHIATVHSLFDTCFINVLSLCRSGHQGAAVLLPIAKTEQDNKLIVYNKLIGPL